MKSKILKTLFVSAMIIGLASCAGGNNTHEHNLYKVNKVDPTCVASGHEAYYKCDDPTCGKIFTDSEGKNETTLESLTIAPTGKHTGGTANCLHKAVCDVCGQEYGELGSHVFNKEVAESKYLAEEATCTEAAHYYKSCECGLAGTETFHYGDPLGHDYVAITGKPYATKCSRCDSFEHKYEFESMNSNAWNVEGAEFKDELWKTEDSNASNGWWVNRVNDAQVNHPGQIWLEQEIFEFEEVKYQLKLSLALGGAEIAKSGFKVTVNGEQVAVSGNMVSPTGEATWVTPSQPNTFYEYDYANITLHEGLNKVRFTIMSGCSCNIDYAKFVGGQIAGDHASITYGMNEQQHWFICNDEGCGKTTTKVDHVFDQEVKSDAYLAEPATCTKQATYYKSCICGKAGTETFGGEENPLGHSYDQEVVDPKYLKSEATCTEAAVYYKSCVCGETGTETFVHGEPLGHNFVGIEESTKNYKCSRCDTYRVYYDFLEMTSNGLKQGQPTDPYYDNIWTGVSENAHKGTFASRINDAAVAHPGEIYFKTEVKAIKTTEVTLKMNLSLGGKVVDANGWKVQLNGNVITPVGNFVSSRTGDGQDWDDNIFHEYTYATFTIPAGHNELMFTIMSGCSCNADCVILEGASLVDNHEIEYASDENQHWFVCTDGCTDISEKVDHVYDQEVTAEEYLVSGDTYYKSCVCGRAGTETFESTVHTHRMKQLVEGKNDVMICSCGRMERKFDLWNGYSESWSEGTVKSDKLWRCENKSDLDNKHWIGHVNDSVFEGGHDGEYWIEIGVEIDSSEDKTVELLFNAGVCDASLSTIIWTLNGVEFAPTGSVTSTGWDDMKTMKVADITLKAGITNVIRISPKQGCQMNWGYLQINSDISTIDACSKLPIIHEHNFTKVIGDTDYYYCDECGQYKRLFDLAASYSNSWSEGTEKHDVIWRQLGSDSEHILESGNWISHLDAAGATSNEEWIQIGVTIDGTVDTDVTLGLIAQVNGGSWNDVEIKVNGVVVTPTSTNLTAEGWSTWVENIFGTITLKAGQTNIIQISPKSGIAMNWCALEIISSVQTHTVALPVA
ncbi:MAG: hypothetical protein IJR08_01330 [Bacilli bacterium]|nr:hypothetical protein [Bacilli bacterium]